MSLFDGVIWRCTAHNAVDCVTCGPVPAEPKAAAEFPCPSCGYTERDEEIHGDHHLCPYWRARPR